MPATGKDHPDVIVFPPVILLATLVLAVALQWWMPLGPSPGLDPAWRIAIGAAAFAAGAMICAVARFSLVRHGTNVNPLQPATALATDGIYRWTRNPIYLGGTLAMIGIGFAGALGWLWPLLLPSVLVLHFGIVRREEQYLDRKFGDAYRRYQARVPRYLGPNRYHHKEN